MSDERSGAIDSAIAQIERKFGAGSVMRMDDQARDPIPVVSTGSLSIDLALGVGGLPRGRVVEIFGPESSGKTTLALHAVAEAQRAGGTAVFTDVEHALDPAYAEKLGVNIADLIVSQPNTGEEALEITDVFVRSNAVDIIVVDSVAALVPRAEIEGDMGDMQVGLQARLMSQAMRKLTANINRSRAIVIFINQLREKIGVMFGNPETTPGGRALKFYSSVRLDIRRIGQIKVGTESVGARTRVRVVKNKVAPPFRTAEFDMMYGTGISREGDLLDLGVEQGILTKSGAHYSYDGTRLGMGRENAKTFLRENADLAERVDQAVRAATLGRPPRTRRWRRPPGRRRRPAWTKTAKDRLRRPSTVGIWTKSSPAPPRCWRAGAGARCCCSM